MAKVNPIQVQKFLKGLDYPASKQDVLQKAEQEGADEDVRSTLEQLPEEQFETPAAISKAIGQIQ
ncbi:MAG: DUF2795 domain-containing protein [Chloroflexota bacterium]|nr:DUF2795 domain-containing protein [Chloroflexota bacterium]